VAEFADDASILLLWVGGLRGKPQGKARGGREESAKKSDDVGVTEVKREGKRESREKRAKRWL
jgi:hypothetical protein